MSKKQVLAEMFGTQLTEDAWSDFVGVARVLQQHARTLEKMVSRKAMPGIRGEVQALKEYVAVAEDLLRQLK